MWRHTTHYTVRHIRSTRDNSQSNKNLSNLKSYHFASSPRLSPLSLSFSVHLTMRSRVGISFALVSCLWADTMEFINQWSSWTLKLIRNLVYVYFVICVWNDLEFVVMYSQLAKQKTDNCIQTIVSMLCLVSNNWTNRCPMLQNSYVIIFQI